MTRSATKKNPGAAGKDISKIAALIACASALQVAETFIPHPVPGMRLGLANIMVLIALFSLGPRAAIEVAVIRTIVSSLLLGTFLSPSFIISFSASLISSVFMSILYKIFTERRAVLLGITGISIAGAFIHNFTQLAIVYLLFIKSGGIFLLLPFLGISAVVTGFITSAGAVYVLKKMGGRSALKKKDTVDKKSRRKKKTGHAPKPAEYREALKNAGKIIILICAASAAVIFEDIRVYAGLLVLSVVFAGILRVNIFKVLKTLTRLYWLIIFAFIMPFLFYAGGKILFSAGPLNITSGGAEAGLIFSVRIAIIMLFSAAIAESAAKEGIAAGIKVIIFPMKFAGVRVNRVSELIGSTMVLAPVFIEKAGKFLREYRYKKNKLMEIIPVLGEMIIMLYYYGDKGARK